MTHALTSDQLTVSYEKQPILWDLSFAVPTGQLVGIIGPNGAGKTTLLRTAVGMVSPVSGSLHLLDSPYRQVRDRVAYVPQRGEVEWDFPIRVIDVVLMGSYGRLGLFRWPRRSDWDAAHQRLEQVGMLPFAHRQIAALSGGQKQRVFLARALMQSADLYLLDEPFAGVDAASEAVIIEILQGLRDQGKTVIAVHHDLHSIPATFDWLIMLNMRLVACGPTSKVFNETNLERAYGKHNALLGEAIRIQKSHSEGLVT